MAISNLQIYYKTTQGGEALKVAAGNGHVAIVNILLTAGVDIEREVSSCAISITRLLR